MKPSSEPAPLVLDICPLCSTQRPPLPAILDAVARLAPGQPLRLIAPFEPVPLFQLLAKQGFGHASRTLDDGAWEITFRRSHP
jgi:uncharacterized protein (DUF2249 family)